MSPLCQIGMTLPAILRGVWGDDTADDDRSFRGLSAAGLDEVADGPGGGRNAAAGATSVFRLLLAYRARGGWGGGGGWAV